MAAILAQALTQIGSQLIFGALRVDSVRVGCHAFCALYLWRYSSEMDDSVVYVAHHTAMPVLAPAACQDWRRQLQLHVQVDTDFAYAFASWAEARDAGGQAIADAWSELRMDFEGAEALGKGASAAEGAGLVAEGPPRVRFSRLLKRAPARPGRRGPSQQSVLGDGAAQDLAKLFQEAGATPDKPDARPRA